MKCSITPPEFKKTFALITVLFFMWGLSCGLSDVLNKHFQEVLGVTKAQSGHIQLAYFGAYFCAAIPAGLFMNRFGYRAGIIMGPISTDFNDSAYKKRGKSRGARV